MFKQFILVFFCFNCISVQAEPLTLEQSFNRAAANNPQVKALQARLGVSQAEILTSGARVNPRFYADNGIQEKTYRYGLEQTFQLGGKRKRRVELAQAQREVVLSEINTLLLDIRANVRRAYTQLFYGQERRRMNGDLLQNTQELFSIAQKRKEAGDIAGLDVLQIKIPLLNAKNDLQISAYQEIEARNTLNNVLNQSVETPLSPPPMTPVLTLEGESTSAPPSPGALQGHVSKSDLNLPEFVEKALSNRPELHQNQKSFEVTQRQLALAKANRTPDLFIGAGSGAVSNEQGKYVLDAYVTASLEIPILNRQQGPIREALARQEQLKREREALEKRIVLEVTNAYNAYRMNQDRIALFKTELLPTAQEVVEKSRLSFKEGKSNILIPIQAQQAYINTRLNYLQALIDLQNSINDLERAVGIGL